MATANRSQPRAGTKGKSKRRKSKAGKGAPKLSRTKRPAGMSLEDWQTELRRQFGAEQKFELKNKGDQPVFSEFEVTNPQSRNTYRVSIRGTRPGDNFCSCPDFSTNTLGTCKHIEFTLARLAARRGGKSALAAGFQPAYSEIFVQYGARREVRFSPGEDCPIEIARLAANYFDSDGKLLPDAFAKFDKFLSKAAQYEHEVRCFEDVLGLVAEVRDGERRREILAKAFPRGTASAAFKKLLKVPLYEYQREGALFAARAGRALIGDEMGLGKTIQAIAAAEILANNMGVERVLIVCPTSLKHQWEREIEKFTNRTVQVIGGLTPKRQEQFAEPSFFKIMNYDTVHRDLDLIAKWSPDLVILDEAQRIKNWNTRVAKSVKRIASPYALVLTGTPLENRLEELVSIVQFIDQHRLGPTFRFLDRHQVTDENSRVVGYQRLDEVSRSLDSILIRRQKSQVLKQLPERLDKHFFVPMTPQQQEMHTENQDNVARVVAKWRRFGFLTEADQRTLMISLQNMRMSCDSTYLLDQKTDHGYKADELATLLNELFEQPGNKVVIFSQWLRMHQLLERRFKGKPWEYVLFHGGLPGPQRRGLVDRFREEQQCRAFMSTDAGGVGLNLQHANVVVNVDLPWNPAVLEQRIGRVHRMGQSQPVQVVNFVAKGTIEEGMLSVLQFKKSLFAGVLDGGEKEVFLGGSRLKRFMETVEKATAGAGQFSVEEPADAADAEVDSSRDDRGSRRDGRADSGGVGSGSNGSGGKSASGGTSASGKSGTSSDHGDDRTSGDGHTAPPSIDPLAGLLQTGLSLLEQLATAARTPADPSSTTGTTPGSGGNAGQPIQLDRDAAGRSFLRVTLPDPDTLDRALGAIGALLEKFRR
ncbi:MAG: DEAD/DEAH box helicase [Pirellulales bacterium]